METAQGTPRAVPGSGSPASDPQSIAQRKPRRQRRRGPRQPLLARRTGRWLVIGCAVAGILGLGWTLGQKSTERPAVDLGYLLQDSVHLWSSSPDATLTFTWVTHANGGVSILLYANSPNGEPVDTLLVLQCDARLKTFESDTADAKFTVTALGNEPADCSHSGSGDRLDESPIQVFHIRFLGTFDVGNGSTSGRFQIWGRTERSWSAEAAGERVSYAPYVHVAGPPRRNFGVPFELRDPAGAHIESVLLGSATETLESYFPPDVHPPEFMHADGQVQADMRPDSFQQEGPQIRWSADWSAVKMRPQGPRIPFYNHTNAMARWSDPSGLANSQLQLLVAGLLLGIGGSVLIEALFIWARAPLPNESARPSPPATKIERQG